METEQVQRLQEMFPDHSKKSLIKMLQKYAETDERRLEKAVEDVFNSNSGLLRQAPPSVIHLTTDEDEEPSQPPVKKPKLIATPQVLFDKVKSLKEKFPDANPDLIYNRLEAAEDLEEAERQLSAEFHPPAAVPLAEPGPGPSGLQQPSPLVSEQMKLSEFVTAEEREGLELVVEMFPEVDPYWVVEQLTQSGKSPQALVDKMTINSNYPKMRARLQQERMESRRQEFLDPASFDPKEFLQIFEDPFQFFTDETRQVSELYKSHVEVALQNDLPNLSKDYLISILQEHGFHYFPSRKYVQYDQIKGINARPIPAIPIRWRRDGSSGAQSVHLTVWRSALPWPKEMDEMFFREVQLVVNEAKIIEYYEKVGREREERMEVAREARELVECSCCFLDDILPEDMLVCRLGIHQFCRDCVRQHAQVQTGEGASRVRCISEECEDEFGTDVLRQVLRPNVINLLLRRMQQDELRDAHLENMESCPFCDFALIMENPADRLFRCLNPECLKESCRECKAESHIPLKCKELEEASQTRMRTFVEERMAEAMIRVCPNCKKRIIKSEGCNKMTCPCGAYICYVCRALLNRTNPYQHFRRVNGCAEMTPLKKLHDEVAWKAGLEAKEKFRKGNPEADKLPDMDVGELVGNKPKVTKNPAQPAQIRQGGGEFFLESSSSEEEFDSEDEDSESDY